MMGQRKLNFLADLALLLDEHGVAICSKREGEYSQVLFQFRGPPGKTHIQTNMYTGRLHVAPHDLHGLHYTLRKELKAEQ